MWEKVMSYKSIEQSIRKYIPDAVIDLVNVEKLKKELLFVSTKPNIYSLKVFDEFSGLDQVAEIRYSINGSSVYISSFVVNEEYQQKGIGKMLFEYALAHGDCMGASRIYGTASPTDPFKGVSSKDDSEYTYDKEVITLKAIYKKLGCRFIDNENFMYTWEQNKKMDKVNPKIKNMIEKCVERDASTM